VATVLIVNRINKTIMNRLLLLICILLVNGCEIPEPLVPGPIEAVTFGPIEPVKYVGNTASKSELVGYFRMNTGEVTGYPPSTMIYVDPHFRPVTTAEDFGQDVVALFAAEDQEVFFESLKTELLARDMIESVSSNYNAETLEVIINFIETKHINISYHEYRLRVMLLIKYKQASDFKIYSIRGTEGVSIWTKISTKLMAAKTNAAEKLLTEVITDIDKFILQLPN